MLPVFSVTAERRRIWATLQVDENVLPTSPMGKSFTNDCLCLFLPSVANSSSLFFSHFNFGFWWGLSETHFQSNANHTHK